MRPPVGYFGAKVATADQIVALMPPHAGYIEPFAGSLAVLLAKPPSKVEIANDLDQKLVTFWRVLRDRPDALISAAALTPHSRLELEHAVNGLDTDDELELARRVWIVLTQGRSRTLQRTGWRFFADSERSSFQTYMAAYRDRLESAAARLATVSLECRPAIEVIDQYGAYPSNLLYVDPPYLGAVRSSEWGGRYTHDMRADAPHRDLAEHLHASRAAVLLSGYASPLYDDELFADWDRIEISAFSGNATDGRRTEVLWSNRPLRGYYLFDFNFGKVEEPA